MPVLFVTKVNGQAMPFHFKGRCSTETPLFQIKLNDARLRGSEETVMDADAEEKLQKRQRGSFWLKKSRLEFMC